MTRFLRDLRINLGLWLIGERFIEYCARLVVISDQALRTVRPDGSIINGEIPDLMNVLYSEPPGPWAIRVVRLSELLGD